MATLTSTIAWCTSCVESVHRAHCSTLDDDAVHFMVQVLGSHIVISMSSMAHFLWLDLSPFTGLSCPSPSSSSIPSCSLSSTTPSSWQIGATPPQKRVRTPWTPSPLNTSYEPNLLTFGELNDSSVPFSFMIPSTDQDVDDVTLGEMLTVAHRGQVDYCVPGGMSVSQSSSVMFDGSGQPDGEKMVDHSRKSGVPFNMISAHSNFSEDIQAERMVDRSGKPAVRNSSNAQIRTLLEEQRQTIIAEYREKVKQLTQKKSADSYKDKYGDRNWNFVKLINTVLQKWKNYGNSRVLPSIRSRDENLSRIRTLFWNYQAEYRNCKMKKIVWTILRIFRMLNQFAVEIPTLPVDQCHSHLIRCLEKCCDSLSYRRAAEKGRQAFGTHMVYRETFLQIHLHLHQLLILKNYINGIRPKSRSIHQQWRKVEGQNKIKIWDASQDRQPKIQSSSVDETLERIMGQTNNDCRFQIVILTNSPRQQRSLVGR